MLSCCSVSKSQTILLLSLGDEEWVFAKWLIFKGEELAQGRYISTVLYFDQIYLSQNRKVHNDMEW